MTATPALSALPSPVPIHPEGVRFDDEAALVGEVMEAAPTLTAGQVTVGPHA